MKEFFRSFFASLLAIIIAGVLLLVVFVGIIANVVSSITDKQEKAITGSILRIDLSKRIHEQGEANPFATFSKETSYKAGLYDIIHAIEDAKYDDQVKGIYLHLASSPNNWATLQELQKALSDFKQSGKFIYSYGEVISQSAYYVATASDSIFLNPVGALEFKGFATILSFFKGTLDKLEIEPEIFYAGKFKSATEPFRTDKMSESNKLQVQAFQAGMWNEFLLSTSVYTRVPIDSLNKIVLNGSVEFPEDALNAKLVGGLLYADQVAKLLKRKTGLSESEKLEFVDINEYAEFAKRNNKTSENKIAVLFAEGEIVDGEQNSDYQIASEDLTQELMKLRKNDKVKAVVLRVNSPGGSALASDVILREIKLLQEKKPVVVSMGDYAASGGYYISSSADSIFALPNTITGSIGVFGMLFNVDKLMKNKIGVTFDGVKNAPYADFPATTRPLTADESARMQRSVDRVYAQFKQHVARGRGMTEYEVDSIAQGRVWTGTDALKIGLVDAIGDMNRAIESAATLAKVKNYKVVTYPEPTDKISNLMKRISSSTETKAIVKEAIKEEVGAPVEWFDRLKKLEKMNGKVMATMPFTFTVQ